MNQKPRLINVIEIAGDIAHLQFSKQNYKYSFSILIFLSD